MADDNTAATILGATASAVGQNIVNVAQSKRQWRYQQAAMDKQQALNLETWNMQNAYNTPQQQMQRLQDAGLNPRLIYGEGSSAPNMAGPLDTAQAPVRQTPDLKTPDLMNYYSIRQMDAQYKQTTMATDIMQKTAGLKDIEMSLKNLNLMKENIHSKDYEYLRDIEVDTKKLAWLRTNQLLFNEERKGALMDQTRTFREKQMTGMDLDNAFKLHRNELAKLGIYTHDHPAFRVLIQASKRMNIDLGELLQSGAENLKYLMDLSKK